MKQLQAIIVARQPLRPATLLSQSFTTNARKIISPEDRSCDEHIRAILLIISIAIEVANIIHIPLDQVIGIRGKSDHEAIR